MDTQERQKASPFSIRITEAEKALLRDRAGSVPLGTFIRDQLLDAGQTCARAKRSGPIKDGEALGQLLGLLGQSRIANNLNQLAKAAHLGALPVSEETENDIREACGMVREIRQLLLAALGLKIMEEVGAAPSLGEAFGASAGATQHDS
jgi:hypothetical protein